MRRPRIGSHPHPNSCRCCRGRGTRHSGGASPRHPSERSRPFSVLFRTPSTRCWAGEAAPGTDRSCRHWRIHAGSLSVRVRTEDETAEQLSSSNAGAYQALLVRRADMLKSCAQINHWVLIHRCDMTLDNRPREVMKRGMRKAGRRADQI